MARSAGASPIASLAFKVPAVGVYPATGLREAREARDEAKKLLAMGQAPSLAKKLAKLSKAAASANCFDAIAAELLEKKRREQKADRTIVKFEWFMSLLRVPPSAHGQLSR